MFDRYRIFIVLLCCFAGPSTAAQVDIQGIRIWAAPESTRVVFDLSGPADHKITMLADPFRAVIDISQAVLKDELAQPADSDRFIRRLRSAVHGRDIRVVLDLKKFARLKSFPLPPNKKYSHRLVLDIFTGVEEQDQYTPPIADAVESPANVRDVIIAIDAGHGGEDPGSIGPSGTYEKNVVLALARRLAERVNRVPGMKAVLIRESDYFISLRNRIIKARQHRADLFVSIHADSFRDPRVSGSSVYVLSQRGASSEHARWLAERENASDLIGGVSLEDKDEMLASVLLDLSQTASLEASIDVAEKVLAGMGRIGKLRKSSVESAGFAVLKSPDIPSLLIEAAYLSNPNEEQKLLNAAYQEKLAGAILDGMVSYFRTNPPEGTLMAMDLEPGNRFEYVINRGDTLSEIAQQYRISLQKLRQVNGLQSDRIRVGQKLLIPASGI